MLRLVVCKCLAYYEVETEAMIISLGIMIWFKIIAVIIINVDLNNIRIFVQSVVQILLMDPKIINIFLYPQAVKDKSKFLPIKYFAGRIHHYSPRRVNLFPYLQLHGDCQYPHCISSAFFFLFSYHLLAYFSLLESLVKQISYIKSIAKYSLFNKRGRQGQVCTFLVIIC